MVNSMALLNISQAAKAAGKDRNTIKRYMRDGRLSSSKDGCDKVVIDSAELVRVFGALVSDGSTDAPDKTSTESPENNSIHQLTIETLVQQLEAAQQRETAALEREEWLKRQLEEEKERSRELERRMLPPGEDTPSKKPGFFRRIFG